MPGTEDGVRAPVPPGPLVVCDPPQDVPPSFRHLRDDAVVCPRESGGRDGRNTVSTLPRPALHSVPLHARSDCEPGRVDAGSAARARVAAGRPRPSGSAWPAVRTTAGGQVAGARARRRPHPAVLHAHARREPTLAASSAGPATQSVCCAASPPSSAAACACASAAQHRAGGRDRRREPCVQWRWRRGRSQPPRRRGRPPAPAAGRARHQPWRRGAAAPSAAAPLRPAPAQRTVPSTPPHAAPPAAPAGRCAARGEGGLEAAPSGWVSAHAATRAVQPRPHSSRVATAAEANAGATPAGRGGGAWPRASGGLG